MNLEQNLFYFYRLCSSYSIYASLAVKLFIYFLRHVAEKHIVTYEQAKNKLLTIVYVATNVSKIIGIDQIDRSSGGQS